MTVLVNTIEILAILRGKGAQIGANKTTTAKLP